VAAARPADNLLVVSRSSTPPPSEPFLPGSYGLQVVSIARRWGIESGVLLDGIGVDEVELEAPGAIVPLSTMSELVRRARSLTNEPGLGILIGLETRPNTYGYLSFAAMSAASLGESIELVIRFGHALSNVFTTRLNRAGDIAGLVVEENCDLGDVREILLLGLLVGLRMNGCALTGRAPWRPIDVAFPEPSYYRRFAHEVPELRFDQPINQVVLLKSDLELPLLTPDRAALRLAVEQCELSMRSLGLGASIEERVLSVVLGDDGPPPFEKIAVALGLSSRTLKRRLAESGFKYSELVEKARRERALLLLRSPELSLDDIAEKLGYSTVSNLVRAFRRWTGMTPTAYRRGVNGRLAVHLPLQR
jgi:AraC-like DNA-binding protein